MLADATGHGLPAAISLLPALQVFYGTARKDLPVPEVVREMNRRMREYLSAGFYLAAILLSVDSASRRVQVWNGGMPPGLWLRDGIEVPTDVLDSCHLPLGILDDQQFDASCRSLSCAGGGQLVLYSDGLVEAADARGEAFGVRRLRDLLAGRSGEEGMRLTLEVLTSHLGGHPARDDISLVTVALA
jgi:serine phosphatase RsbU (regulator of sigma subunit)